MRPNRDEWGLKLALLTAQRATCCRRQVGCVLLDSRGHVLSTGYNGVAAGLPHCNHYCPSYFLNNGHPYACAGWNAPSGMNLDACQAIHAEQNALLQCRDIYQIHTAYVTASPCMTCCKLLLNTSCKRIVFAEEYPHPAATELWKKAGREWAHLPVGDAAAAPELLEALQELVSWQTTAPQACIDAAHAAIAKATKT